LHGGGASDDPTATYRFHNGRMRCGLTVVSWVLTDSRAGDGGFCCIPGSHKSNYPLPPAVARLEIDPGCVREVPLRAGSILLFTEALVHGTLPWRAAHERRALFYKYAPGPLAYAREHVPDGVREVLHEFTPSERAVLEPPYRPDRPLLPRT